MNDIIITDFQDERFIVAFKKYFIELGIEVSHWDGLFQQMNEEQGNLAIVRFSPKEGPTDTATNYYINKGCIRDSSYSALNENEVFIKLLK